VKASVWIETGGVNFLVMEKSECRVSNNQKLQLGNMDFHISIQNNDIIGL
jgi:hypothetical protein